MYSLSPLKNTPYVHAAGYVLQVHVLHAAGYVLHVQHTAVLLR